MLIAMEGIGLFINMPIGFQVLLISIAVICCILFILYYRFNHFRKKIHFPDYTSGSENMMCQKDWEQKMLELTTSHKQVKLMRYNFVLDDYNQIAYKKLNKIRKNISELSTDVISLIPAARWLYDNYQMMYREVKKVRASGTSYEILPILTSKEHRGFPRIYIVAKTMVALSGGHLNEENISIMLNAYQKEIPLTDKEIWVLPEMLGFSLLENIIEVAEEIINIIELKSQADRFVRDKLGEGNDAIDITAFLQKTDVDCKENFSFHSHVVYLLKNMSYTDAAIQRYLDYQCISKDKLLKPATLFLEEGRIESNLEASIRTLIVSLRDINEFDEEMFFERHSYLEQILSNDPDGIYAKMDSESRGMYRGIIVELSHRYKMNEETIANKCIELAKEGRTDLNNSHHVGAYLLGKGYPVLKAKVMNKPRLSNIKEKRNVIGVCYFLSLLIIFCVINYLIYLIMNRLGHITKSYQYVVTLLFALPLFAGIALEITNFIFTRRIHVKKLPSIDYLNEIPDSSRTFVIMPVIVSSKEQGLEYLDRLQKHYLANHQSNLYFALLADYEDAPELTMPKDEVIENALLNRVKELNEQYPATYQRFSLFVRYRKWNPSENCYMGWERKRGKLEEFNKLLNGISKDSTSFSTIDSCKEIFDTFKYVITLDADTNLIRDNAAKLVGLIDHPLNRPILDAEGKSVTEGYVIIQPSVRNHIVDKKGSRFAEIFGGQSGLAHYSTVISDIYQDIFGKGIYIGKGVYDVKAFHLLLHNTIPENRILSHDLLESCYARTAFSSNAKIMDSFPNSVISFAKREHRWIRGDWQLFPWLFRRNTANGRKLCALSKWKILDNLRRSMVPLSKTLFIILNLAFLPRVFYLWLPLVFFSDLFNLIVLMIAIIKQKMIRPKLALVSKGLLREIGDMIQRAYLELVLTPYRAYVATDAMVRTLYRLFISKKNLLRWNTAESVDASIINTLKGYFLTMWSSMIPAAVLLILLFTEHISLFGAFLYAILAIAWVMAFSMAYRISQPKEKLQKKEKEHDKELLLDTSRRTWQFFKELSTKENNWLCPDYYQVSRVEKISYKTSPTNIGLQFLSILSARDFGYETVSATVENVERLLDTILKLPKWNGHLYNWYEITTLEILNPAYISTVDSGNFLGHLVALKNGLLEQIENPIFPDSLVTELRKTMKLSNYGKSLRNDYKTIGDFIKDITEIWDDLNDRELLPEEDPRWIRELMSTIEHMVSEAAGFDIKGCSFQDYPTILQQASKNNKYANAMITRIKELSSKIERIYTNADFHFLYNSKRMLFHIGYHVSSHILDAGCYDLMASESALTSFLAVARGEVPLRHWQRLGRPLTMIKGIPCFVSWSGTMFEYLMPNLVLKGYEGSVFEETSKAAVLQHIIYAKETGIPWGISESQYFRFDMNGNYQYKAFGVPKLRLQPMRRNPLVVASYATMLALEYATEESLENLELLKKLGMFGEYGFYEAIDYNSPDSEELTPYCIVKSYMAHHQGMNMVAINNFINEDIMRKRFHAEAMVKATEVLLEEKRHSHLISMAKRGYTIKLGRILFREHVYSNRYVNRTAPKMPVTNYLSNNRYSLLITSDGDGFSSYQDMLLYRFRADMYANTGNYIYIKDCNKGKVWSATYHPTRMEPEEYQVIFSPHQAEFKRVDGDIASHTCVSLSSDHTMEIRKVSLTNHSNEDRVLEITSYLEVVGDSHMAEMSHPAFNKLFIESEFIEDQSIFLSKRRSSKGKEYPYIMHMVKTAAKPRKRVEYENDRLKFLGRNNTAENPIAVMNSIPLSNQSGFCNDPIMSLRLHISVKAGETACASFITGVCTSKEEAIKIGEELSIDYRIDDIFEKFRLQSDIELKYLEITRPQLNAFQDLISPIYYPSCYYRGPDENIRRNYKNQSFLWKFGVSGDNPIMLLRVETIEAEGIVRDVLKAYEYFKINDVTVDLIILIESKYGYLQEMDNLINDLTSSLRVYDTGEKPSLFTIHTYQLIPSELDLLYTVARVVFTEETGIYFRNVKENLNEIIED